MQWHRFPRSRTLAVPEAVANNPSNCQPVAIQWSGACGTGAMGATQASVQCPIGVDLVTASVSLNGSSFLPQVQIPPFNVIVTDFVLSSSVYSGSSGTVAPGTPWLGASIRETRSRSDLVIYAVEMFAYCWMTNIIVLVLLWTRAAA